MNPMADWLHLLGASSFDVFWRPLLVWTLVCLPLYAALRLWRGAPSLVQYHAHLALLLALPLSLALAPFASWLIPTPEAVTFAGDLLDLPLPAVEPIPVEVSPDAVAPSAEALGFGWGVTHWIGVLTVLAAGCAVLLLIRLAYLTYGLRRFRRRLSPVDAASVRSLCDGLAREMGVRVPVALYSTQDETTPMTFGWQRPVIVLPEALLGDAPALRLTLLHELVHVRRRDYVVGWVVRIVHGLFAVHPGVWVLRRRIDQYREISCDAETLAGGQVKAGQYARLLVRFSPLTDVAGPAALRMVEFDSTLKKRITAMHNLTQAASSLRLRRWSLPLAGLLLLIPALFIACATENTTSETVIVAAESADAVEEVELADATEEAEHRFGVMVRQRSQEEELAQRRHELALRQQEMALHEMELRLKESVERQKMQELDRVHEQRFAAQELKRFAVQMEYLKEEIKKGKRALDDPAQRKELVERGEFDLTTQRLQLLNALYMQRLEQYETMKMQQFTEEALRKSADAP